MTGDARRDGTDAERGPEMFTGLGEAGLGRYVLTPAAASARDDSVGDG
jgi:hypothetical protein